MASVKKYFPREVSGFLGQSVGGKLIWTDITYDVGDPQHQYVCEGFSDGFAVWEVVGNSLEQIISVKQKSTTVVCLVPSSTTPPPPPGSWNHGMQPVFAIVSEESHGRNCVNFFSLSASRYFHCLTFDSEVLAVKCSRFALGVVLRQKIFVYKLETLEELAHVETFPSPTGCGVMSLGQRWLAFPSNHPFDADVGLGPVNTYGSTLLDMSKDVVDTVTSGLHTIGTMSIRAINSYMQPGLVTVAPPKESSEFAGSLKIIDLMSGAVVAHFRAHRCPLAAVVFDPSGALLATAPIDGHNINIFRISPQGAGSNRPPQIVHCFALVRGMTASAIHDINFSIDSQWLAVTSARGTTHIFAISADGSRPTPDTHLPTQMGAEAQLLGNTADPLIDHMDWDGDWDSIELNEHDNDNNSDNRNNNGNHGQPQIPTNSGSMNVDNRVLSGPITSYAVARIKHGMARLIPAGVSAAASYVGITSPATSSSSSSSSLDPNPSELSTSSSSDSFLLFRSFFPWSSSDALFCLSQDGNVYKYRLRPCVAPEETTTGRGLLVRNFAAELSSSAPAVLSSFRSSQLSYDAKPAKLALNVTLDWSAHPTRAASSTSDIATLSRVNAEHSPVVLPGPAIRWVQRLSSKSSSTSSTITTAAATASAASSGLPPKYPLPSDRHIYLSQLEISSCNKLGRAPMWCSGQFSLKSSTAAATKRNVLTSVSSTTKVSTTSKDSKLKGELSMLEPYGHLSAAPYKIALPQQQESQQQESQQTTTTGSSDADSCTTNTLQFDLLDVVTPDEEHLKWQQPRMDPMTLTFPQSQLVQLQDNSSNILRSTTTNNKGLDAFDVLFSSKESATAVQRRPMYNTSYSSGSDDDSSTEEEQQQIVKTKADDRNCGNFVNKSNNNNGLLLGTESSSGKNGNAIAMDINTASNNALTTAIDGLFDPLPQPQSQSQQSSINPQSASVGGASSINRVKIGTKDSSSSSSYEVGMSMDLKSNGHHHHSPPTSSASVTSSTTSSKNRSSSNNMNSKVFKNGNGNGNGVYNGGARPSSKKKGEDQQQQQQAASMLE